MPFYRLTGKLHGPADSIMAQPILPAKQVSPLLLWRQQPHGLLYELVILLTMLRLLFHLLFIVLMDKMRRPFPPVLRLTGQTPQTVKGMITRYCKKIRPEISNGNQPFPVLPQFGESILDDLFGKGHRPGEQKDILRQFLVICMEQLSQGLLVTGSHPGQHIQFDMWVSLWHGSY
jgi:hypothetical protein